MTIDRIRQQAFSVIVAWVHQRIHDSMGPWKGLLNKKPAYPAPTGEQLERLAAEVMGRTNVWGALRQVGFEPSHIPEQDRRQALESLAVEWAGQLHKEVPGLDPDSSRIQMRVRLQWIDTTSVFTEKNAIRAGLERFQETGEERALESVARNARGGLEAAAVWGRHRRCSCLGLG